MKIGAVYLKLLTAAMVAVMLEGCGEPRAVMLPLQYPDGSAVVTTNGEPVMVGYQTYGSSLHANTTALYQNAKPATCATCANVGMVVTEPSTLRQATGVLETATLGAGAVMAGVGIMNNAYGSDSSDTNINQNTIEVDDRNGHHRNDTRRNQYSRTGWGHGNGHYDGRH